MTSPAPLTDGQSGDDNPGESGDRRGIRRIRGQTGRFLLLCPRMDQLPRIVAVNIPHNVAQRGDARRFILSGDAERLLAKKWKRPVCPRFPTDSDVDAQRWANVFSNKHEDAHKRETRRQLRDRHV